MDVRAQVSMVFHLDKCIGCHTCSIACKNIWTDRKGAEYMWWNNVETKPGTGYPTQWEDQGKYKGGWEKKEDGTETVVWKIRNRREERDAHKRFERKPFRKHKPEGSRAEGEQPQATEAKAPRPDKGPRKDHRHRHGKHERDEQRQERKGDQRPERKGDQRQERREKPFKVDPDSPFAALAALKFRK